MIERARAANVQCMLVTGTCVSTSRKARKLCEATTNYPLYFTAGVHPHHAKECNDATLGELRQLLASDKCVAVGECGLDFNRNFSPPDVQEQWFDAQVCVLLTASTQLQYMAQIWMMRGDDAGLACVHQIVSGMVGMVGDG